MIGSTDGQIKCKIIHVKHEQFLAEMNFIMMTLPGTNTSLFQACRHIMKNQSEKQQGIDHFLLYKQQINFALKTLG